MLGAGILTVPIVMSFIGEDRRVGLATISRRKLSAFFITDGRRPIGQGNGVMTVATSFQ
jgi:hypothetical protein